MEKTSENVEMITINVQVDRRLNAFSKEVLFPKKVERAKAFLEKNGLPRAVEEDLAQHQSNLNSLQKALLQCYVSEPTIEQLAQLNNFLTQLFPDGLEKTRA